MLAAAEVLDQIVGKDALLTCDPETPDFTSDKFPTLVIQSGSIRAGLPFSDPKEVFELVCALPEYLGRDKALILAWDIKPLCSYLKFKLKLELKLPKVLYDLKAIESYFGIHKEAPKTAQEAIHRLAAISQIPAWKTYRELYQSIYLPLLLDVLPSIETTGLAHRGKKCLVYPCYEVEGQSNGRLRCTKAYGNKSYLPHSLGPDERQQIYPPFDQLYMLLDYNNLEVSVLQWLSKDEALGEVLASGDDVYLAIWQKVTGQRDEAKRSVCKEIFLPVIYGMGYRALAKKFNISENSSKALIDRLRKTFHKAFHWIESQTVTPSQRLSGCDEDDSIFTDQFGRRRKFDETYKVRNFAVQSPAALICLLKLVKLHNALKADKSGTLCISQHDGYGILVNRNNVKPVYQLSKQILEQPETLFDGLKLKTTVKTGENLNELAPI